MIDLLNIKNCVSEFHEDPLGDVFFIIDTV